VIASAILVAHIAALDGNASLDSARNRRTVAFRNAPIFQGDALVTGAGSRAEVRFDPNVAVRLDENAELRVVNLVYGRREVALLSGSLASAILRSDDGPQIDTPQATLQANVAGLYRVRVDAAGTTVDVRRGTLFVSTPNGREVLSPGEQVTITGTSAAPSLHYNSAPSPDAFDAYDAVRDAALARSQAGDLDAYGSWVQLKRYGRAWQPREYAGWAPYKLGRWLWRSESGWTWISRESWGWTPYHYGAWTDDAKYGWCWVPPRSRDTAWAPSTAAFFALVVRGRTQSIGWVPLAPGESSHSNLGGYRNATGRGGITLAAYGAFTSGDFSRLSSPPLARISDAILRAPQPH
jgi:hypothetical protein